MEASLKVLKIHFFSQKSKAVGFQKTNGWFCYCPQVLFQVHLLPHPTTDFYDEESTQGDTMNKTRHEDVSLGSKAEDQGGELSLSCLGGAPYRYLSGQRAGGGCFVAKQSGKWPNLGSSSHLTGVCQLLGKSGLPRKSRRPVSFEC